MNPRRCMACWKCVEKCPKKVIGKTGFLGHRHVIFENADACIGCNKCIKTCLQGVFFKGIGLHIAGHGTSHETWHNWGVAHVVASFIWLLSVMAHVRRHKHWYKTLVSKRVTCKRLITFFLSIAFLIVAVTGILLVAYVEGPGSSIGLWHYKLGILLWVLSLIHALYRK